MFHCVFKSFRNSNRGGSFLARDTTVIADSTIWSSIIGNCGQGMMIESSSNSFAFSYLKNCTFTKCSNFCEAKGRAANGGALGLFGCVKCYCTDCEIRENKAGSIMYNCGILGGIYMKGEFRTFILSLTSCEFEGNRGLLEGFCVHIVNGIIFESDDCIFKDCISSTIWF